MIYKLYTYPNCHTCHEIKDFLRERGIQYNEVNLGSNDGHKDFSEIWREYKANGGNLKRDDKKMTILPVLVEKNSKIEKIVQGEDIKKLFS